ncbi:MAG: hypothetical protein GY800_06985 [Planctomycetes bacterium]|nr:hypothetical protein [Planctomycetota bacterium]
MTPRILLIISLVFSLSVLPGMSQLYATCGTCGVTAPSATESGGGSSHDGLSGAGAMNAALFAAMFSTLMAAKSQEEGMAEADIDRLIEELAVAFKLSNPTVKPHFHEEGEHGHDHHEGEHE